jgi:FAD:protein FMN transferase
LKYFFLTCTLLLAGCFFSDKPEVPLGFQGDAFGAYYKVKYLSGPTTPSPTALKAEVEDLIKRYDEEFSLWKATSFLSKFNESKNTSEFEVSDWALQLSLESQKIFLASFGTFDPSVKSLVNLWGFGKNKSQKKITDSDISRALKNVGFNLLEINLDKKTWRKKNPELQLDFNSIAPGQVADLITELLSKRGVKHSLVDASGELRAMGERSQGMPWRVGIEKPSDKVGEAIMAAVPLTGGIATSGSYRNYLETSMGRISHTIDPRSGKQPAHKIVSATVIAGNALEADAWATAMMVVGPEAMDKKSKIYQEIQNRKLAIYLIEEATEGKLIEHANSFMQELWEKR